MRKISFLTGLFFVLSTALFAAKPLTPEAAVAKGEGVILVDTAEAKKLFDAGSKFCDARKKLEYGKSRIKGALSTYYNEKGGKKNKKVGFDASKDQFKVDNVPENCVFYCNGPTCWKSYKAAYVTSKAGKNAYWYRDGIPAWKAAGNLVE